MTTTHSNGPTDGYDFGIDAAGFASSVESMAVHRPTIGCIIPAYNEEESIAAVLESLLGQSRVPDVIHVIANNTSDKTVEIASRYAGPHFSEVDGVEQFTEVYVHDIGENKIGRAHV